MLARTGGCTRSFAFNIPCLSCVQDYEIHETGLSTFSLCSDDDDDDDNYFNEEDCDQGSYDETGGGGGDDSSPFAPAEMYLSDLLDMTGGGGRSVYVPDTLMYTRPSNDPLYTLSLKEKLGEVLKRHQDPEGIVCCAV